MVLRQAASARHPAALRCREFATDAELAKLPRDEAALLRMRYGLGERPRTPAEVADALNLSCRDAARLHVRALQRLRWRSMAANDDTEWDEV